MSNITIPPEALEAAARVIERNEMGNEELWKCSAEIARAALLAGLKAWPHRKKEERHDWSFAEDGSVLDHGRKQHLILPLTENSDE